MPVLSRYKWKSWAERAFLSVTKHTPDIIAIDTETTGVNYYDEPFCATLTWRGAGNRMESAYISLEDDEEQGYIAAQGLALLGQILKQVPAWLFHNAKFDLQMLLSIGVLPEDWQDRTVHDTQLIYHLLDENGRKGLKSLAVTVLNESDVIEVEVKSGPNKGTKRKVPREQYQLRKLRRELGLKATDGYYHLPRWAVVPYAVKDTEFTLRLFETLWPKFQSVCDKDPRLMELYADELQLMRVLLNMESQGFGVDQEYVNQMASEYGVRIMEGLGRVAELAGSDDPKLPNSPKQLKQTFHDMGEPVEGTSVLILRQLVNAGTNPKAVEFAEAILSLRSDSKIMTYLKAIQSEQKGGRWHPNFNPVQARTGRMSSGSAVNK